MAVYKAAKWSLSLVKIAIGRIGFGIFYFLVGRGRVSTEKRRVRLECGGCVGWYGGLYQEVRLRVIFVTKRGIRLIFLKII
jgi:hypothetical protein